MLVNAALKTLLKIYIEIILFSPPTRFTSSSFEGNSYSRISLNTPTKIKLFLCA